jgi:hypothetical protein
MRTFLAFAVTLLLFSPSADANPRDFLLRKLLPGMRSVKAATTAPVRRRAALPPHPSPCADAVIASPVDVSWFALSGDTIFISDFEDGILRVAKSGGTPVQVAADPSQDIGAIVVDDNAAYFIVADNDVTGSIYSVPRAGGTPKLLAANLPAPVDLKIDGTSIYWLNLGTIMGDDVAGDGSLERMLKDGTGRQKLVGGLSAPSMIDLDATDVYYGETGFSTGDLEEGLSRVSKSGGTPTKLVDGTAVFAVAASGSDVFYSGASTTAFSVSRIAKSGGAPQVLIPDEVAFNLAVRDGHVYSAAIDSSLSTLISSVATDGTGFRILKAVDLDSAAIAIDDCAVYYAAASSLQRTPR